MKEQSIEIKNFMALHGYTWNEKDKKYTKEDETLKNLKNMFGLDK